MTVRYPSATGRRPNLRGAISRRFNVYSQHDVANRNGKWIWRFHPAGAENVRIVIFPHAGGSASYYHSLSAKLSKSADVLAVQYPGRQNRSAEPCVQSVPELARRIAAELRSLAAGPMALFGHSMGAAIAFEVARLLSAHDRGPCHLFVSSRSAPTRPRRDRNLHLGTDQEILDEVSRVSGTDPELLRDESLRGLILPALRADYRAIETYRYLPGARLSCPITALTGDTDPTVEVRDVLGWQDETDAGFVTRVFPGGHFYLDHHLPSVAGTLLSALGVGEREGSRPC